MSLTDDKLDVWAELLSDLTEEQLKTGVKTFVLKHKEIYPNTNVVAYIREYGLGLATQMTPAEAWGLVLKAIGSVGVYGVPKFENDAVKRSVDCVGWRDICMSPNIGVERAHFMRAYEALVARDFHEQMTGC